MNDITQMSLERFQALQYTNQEFLHPAALVLLVVATVFLWVLPRSQAIAPVIGLVCFVPPGQRVMIAGVDFPFVRLSVSILIAVCILRSWFQTVRWRPLDFAVIGLFLLPVPMALMRGHPSALGGFLGGAMDYCFAYLASRAIMRDRRSLLNFVRALFFVCIPVCLCFVVEKLTGRNLFSVFGGVPEFTAVRDGKLRVQGAFAHPILAGTWWAVCMPLFLSYGFLEGAGRLRRLVPVAGGVCSFLIVLMTASSTPIAAMIVGVLAFGIFRWRAQVWGIRWWAVLGLAIVHMLVESGIHGLVLTKVSFVSGSTGYHRYLLIDSAIRNVSEWFFVGVNETWHWGWGLDDVTCQYVKAAVDGGVIAFVILLLIVAKSVAIPVNFSFRSAMASECRLSWGVASAMAANATALVTVTYFGQITILLAILLAVSLNIDVFRRPRISEEKYVTAKFAVPVVGLKAAEGSAQSHELARFFSRRPPMQG